MPHILRIAKGVAVAGCIALYAVLMHRVNVAGQPGLLGALLAAAPLFLLALAILMNVRTRVAGGALFLSGTVALWLAWPVVARHSGTLFWLQDIALLLGLLFVFGRTLLPGRKPLCVTFAEMMHGPLSPEHARYARRVTVAWAAFFAGLATISTLLFLLAPLAMWSLYANFMVLPLIGVMFIVEYRMRKRVLADAPHGRLLDAVNAYLKFSRPQA